MDDLTERAARVLRARRDLIPVARRHPEVFAKMVMRDEETGRPIKLAEIHKAWHKLMGQHDRLIIWSHPEGGKSFQCAGRVLWEIGKNPQLRVVVLSNTHSQAKKVLSWVSKYIEKSDDYHQIFPDVKPADPWTDGAITVERPVIAKDPTVQAAGAHGQILGSRIDLLIIDDLLDWENCRNQEQRDKLWDWLQKTIITRLTKNARVIVIGNAWHPDDAIHKFAALKGWAPYRYPVLDDAGQSRWPAAFSLERIQKIRESMSPLAFAQQYLCVTHDDSAARFKREWFEVCEKRGERLAVAESLATRFPDLASGNVPSGYKVITGVDLAVSRKDSADLTVLFTLLLHPNGDREILSISSGRWPGPEIVGRVVDTYRRFGGFTIVENNAAQDYIVQYTAQYGIPVKGFTTTATKNHPELGIESLAGELAAGRWIIPSRGGLHKEVSAWKDELLYYDPSAHTGDRVMASYFAVQGIAMTAPPPRVEMGFIDWAGR